MRLTLVLLLVLCAITTSAWANLSPETKCQKTRLAAWAKHLSCSVDYMSSRPSCRLFRVTYQGLWPKLQARFPGTSCAAPRFVDNGDQTVTDNLTDLVWEKKDDLGGIHDKDDIYAWSTGAPYKEDGTAFSTFLATLNASAFAGSRGWRLPTRAELQTIALYPCQASPCIDSIFGPTGSYEYWSSSSDFESPVIAWAFNFYNGELSGSTKSDGFTYVRAVRGGS